jgi:hypothetical protein
MAGAPTFYYRFFKTVPTLLRFDNISGRLYMIVMIYKTLVFYIKTNEAIVAGSTPYFINKTILLC